MGPIGTIETSRRVGPSTPNYLGDPSPPVPVVTIAVVLTFSLTPYELARANCSYVRYYVQITGQTLRVQRRSGICRDTF